MPRQKLTQADIKEAQKMKRAGCLDKDIAAYIGIRADTFSKWVNNPKTDNQRQLVQSLKKAEAGRKRNLLSMIYNAATNPKTWQAAAWLLERQYPQEFAKQERTQVEAKVEAAPAFFFDRKEAEDA